MEIIEFVKEYWDSIALVAVVAAVFAVLAWRGERSVIDKIIYRAVTELEREYGAGTGNLKLAAAIERIYPKLPAVVRVLVSADTLRRWIEEGLTEAKKKWEENPALRRYIGRE